jgi:D-amino-acid dehydrogenase
MSIVPRFRRVPGLGPELAENRGRSCQDRAVHDVVVVGGGVLGAALGYELAGAGADTLLVDRQDPGRATNAGAGILAPETAFDDDTRFGLSMAAGAYYRELIPALAESGAPDTGFAECGALVVAMQEWDDELFATTAELAARRCPGVLRALDEDDARALFPPIGPVRGALLNPAAARVDGRQLAAALLHGARSRGLKVQHGSVQQIVLDGDRVVGVEVVGSSGDAARIDCGAVVIAGGAWSPALGEPLGVQLPVAPVRGQILHAHVDDETTGEWPLLQPVLDHYVVTWPGGRVVVGGTFEADAAFDASTTLAGIDQLIAATARLAPTLTGANLVEVRVGLRPVSIDDTPILGPLPGLTGAFVATGHGAHGLLLGPWSARLVAQSVLGQTPAQDLVPFGPDRFSHV